MKYVATGVRVLSFGLFLFLILNGKMMIWLGIFAVSLLLALFFGRLYCGYVCPMNTIMGPIEWLSKKLKIQTKAVPKWLLSGKISWIALFASIIPAPTGFISTELSKMFTLSPFCLSVKAVVSPPIPAPIMFTVSAIFLSVLLL